MRRGGRLPERLTARDLAGRMKLTFAVHRDSLSLVVICSETAKLLPARHLCVVNHVCTINYVGQELKSSSLLYYCAHVYRVSN